jgi:polyphenol oxidase
VRWRELNGGIRWLEADLPGATAAFSARTGGVSEGAYESLNLGRLTGDRPEAVRENRHRLAAGLGVDPELVLIGRQVHAAHVSRHTGPTEPRAYAHPAPGLPETDGHATAEPGLAPLVFVADCLPVALAGEEGVAMIHCGWRGLAAGIVERGVAEVEATAAAVGPGIGPCCYEVGPEVLAEFESLGPGIATGRRLDLPAVARRLLERAGVTSVEVSDLCTSCNPDLFFSHRRDGGRTGRQAGLVWCRA